MGFRIWVLLHLHLNCIKHFNHIEPRSEDFNRINVKDGTVFHTLQKVRAEEEKMTYFDHKNMVLFSLTRSHF